MSDCEGVKTGKVVRTKGGNAKVEIERSAACEGCKACVFASKKTVIVTAINEAGAKVGDEVTVLPPPPKPLTAFFNAVRPSDSDACRCLGDCRKRFRKRAFVCALRLYRACNRACGGVCCGQSLLFQKIRYPDYFNNQLTTRRKYK